MTRTIALAAIAAAALGTAAAACPSFGRQADASYQLSAGQLASGAQFNVVAGGSNYINGQGSCGIVPLTDRGPGYFTSVPDFSFGLPNMGGRQLAVAVVSECDASLLINTGAANWYYDDDDNGNLDPIITLSRPSNGRLDVWVGTYDGEFCNARLMVSSR
ncbi:MAG: hypothetical protein ACU0BF_11415 [Paracoccaceae bacterium]